MVFFSLSAKMMEYYKYYLLFISFFIFCTKASSQDYNIGSFQKINEIQGNFNGDLDPNDSFGVSIDNLGDLDGNGINDIAVGAFNDDDDGGSNRGAVYILFMDDNDQVISHTKISSTSGGFTGVLDDNDYFGGAVASLGDMNGDGFVELAVGADYDADGGYWSGAVWILSLNADGTVQSNVKISDSEGGFTGGIGSDTIFGTDIENIGDLNGDGVEDLAVGARRDGINDLGAVWILFMNNNLTVNSQQKINSNQGNFSGFLSDSDYFGGSVANIGDLNGDGVVDLAVGAYRDDDGIANSGSIYILFLNSDGTVDSHQKISNEEGNFNDSIAYEALFGESIDGLVDIDNDGKVEIVVGAMKAVASDFQAYGGFYILELNSDGTVSEGFFYTSGEHCFAGELEPQELFGGSVTFLSEEPDNIKIAVGAYRDSGGSFTQEGAIWVINLGESYHFSYEIVTPNCGAEDGNIVLTDLKSEHIVHNFIFLLWTRF